jgi:alpha-galactosidase
MINGKVFHHTPMLPVMDTSPWCVLEYAKPDRSTSVAAIFRTSCEKLGKDSNEYIFKPRGIDPSATFNVKLDSQGLSFTASGQTLMHDGIFIHLEQPLTSELVILQRN